MKQILNLLTLLTTVILSAAVFSSLLGAPFIAVAVCLLFISLALPPVHGVLQVAALQNHTGPNATEDNIGGTKKLIYFAQFADFEVIGEPDDLATATTMAELAENATDFDFATGKKWNKMYVTADTGELTYEPQGETDGKSYKAMLKIFYPGSKSDILGFMRSAKNNQWIVLVPLADNTIHQLGTQDFTCEIVGKWGSGTNSGGRRGVEFEITLGVTSGPFLYTGAISLTPAL